MSNIFSSPLPNPQKTIIIYSAHYWSKLLKFGQPVQFCGALHTYEWRWPWAQNSVVFQFWERGCWGGPKTQKLLFSNQSIETLKLYNISKNKSPKLIRRGAMRVWSWKRATSSQIDLGNRNLIFTKKGPRCTLWWYWLFSLIEVPCGPKSVCFFISFHSSLSPCLRKN